jgi:Tetratricopeptide repeat
MFLRGFALAVALASAPSFAYAQPEPPPSGGPTEEQKKLFSDAKSLYDAGKYEEALPKLRQVVAETHSPNARLYLARALKELKHYSESYDEMSAIANDPNIDPKYQQTKEAAAGELAPLEKLVAHIQIQLTPELQGAPVTVNDKPVPPEKVSSTLTVDPGTEVVQVMKPGGPPEKRMVTVGSGETKTVSFAAVHEEPPPPPPTHAKGLGTLRIVGIGVGALGVVSLAAGIGTGVASDSKFNDVQTACGNKRCTDPKFGDDIDTGKALQNASTATFVIGGVLVAASIPLIIFGGPKATKVEATPTAGGFMLGATGEF